LWEHVRDFVGQLNAEAAMQDIIDELDEVLSVCQRAVANAREPRVAEAMRAAMSLIQEARDLLGAGDGVVLRSER
jgi:hypothetical protein